MIPETEGETDPGTEGLVFGYADATSPAAHGTPFNVKSGDKLSFKIENAQPNTPVWVMSDQLTAFGFPAAVYEPAYPGDDSKTKIGMTDAKGNLNYMAGPVVSGNLGGYSGSFLVFVGNDGKKLNDPVLPVARKLTGEIHCLFTDGSHSSSSGSGSTSGGTGGSSTSTGVSSTTNLAQVTSQLQSALLQYRVAHPVATTTPQTGSTSTVSNPSTNDASTQNIFTVLRQSLQSIQTSLASEGSTLSKDTLSSVTAVVASIAQILQSFSVR